MTLDSIFFTITVTPNQIKVRSRILKILIVRCYHNAKTLILKVKRMNQICSIWNNATQREPTFYDPLENGWTLNIKPIWFDGSQAPSCLDNIILPDTDENIDDEIEEILHDSPDDEQ